MALSPAQRHSQRIAMEQKLKRSQALETTESMHLLIRALETDVEHVRSLPTIADRVEYNETRCAVAALGSHCGSLSGEWPGVCQPGFRLVCYLAV